MYSSVTILCCQLKINLECVLHVMFKQCLQREDLNLTDRVANTVLKSPHIFNRSNPPSSTHFSTDIFIITFRLLCRYHADPLGAHGGAIG
jgi:hypothetical protein